MFSAAWLLFIVLAAAGVRGRAVPLPVPEDGDSSSFILDNPPRIIPDPGSGCSCKEQSADAYICFDRMSCRKFPRNFTVPTKSFLVKTTIIPEIVIGDLDNMHHLTGLNIENGLMLHRITPGVFADMKKLVNLTISYNLMLTYLEEGAFQGLDNLKVLTMIKNGFQMWSSLIPAIRSTVLPKLTVLSVDETKLHSVDKEEFRAMEGSLLEEISMSSCQIVTIHHEGFLPFRKLTSLRLGGNNLDLPSLSRMLDTLVEAGVSLTFLDLQSIGLRATPPRQLLDVIAKSNISRLVLRGNEIEALRAGDFPFMPRLRHLDLTEVELIDVGNGSFTSELMPRLESINLSGNKLPAMLPGFLSNSLVSIDVTHNSGSSGQTNAYFDLGFKTFVNMTNLQYLHVSYNRVVRLTNESFLGLSSLKVLAMKNSSIFKLDDGVFTALANLNELNLERNLFPSYRPMTADMWYGLHNLHILLLGFCGISSLGKNPNIFKHLTGLTHLGLESNALVTLDSGLIFKPLKSLVLLDVSNNEIGSWKNRLFSENPNFRELKASANRLTYLSPAMIQDLEPLETVDLSRNPFNCGCDYIRPVEDWLHGPNVTDQRVRNVSKLFKYKCLSPDEWRDKEISEYMMAMTDRTDCTPSEISLALVIAIPIGVLMICVFGVALLIYRFRHHLRYGGFLARGKMGQDGRAVRCWSNFAYDAFVSYSSSDQAFIDQLVSMLEDHEPYFKLCVYERDFSIGMAITEAVLESIALSKRVLLVVSESFARSQWCAWEAHISAHQRLVFKDDSMFVIKLGDVDEGLLTPTLKYMLKTKIYLEYDSSPEKQNVFWQKLRNALSPPIKRPAVGSQERRMTEQEQSL